MFRRLPKHRRAQLVSTVAVTVPALLAYLLNSQQLAALAPLCGLAANYVWIWSE